MARVGPEELHPLRGVVGGAAFLLAYAAENEGATAMPETAAESEPVEVVRVLCADAAAHALVPGLTALGTATSAANRAQTEVCRYLRAPTGMVPLATARYGTGPAQRVASSARLLTRRC